MFLVFITLLIYRSKYFGASFSAKSEAYDTMALFGRGDHQLLRALNNWAVSSQEFQEQPSCRSPRICDHMR